jgi:hypothetical protein
MLGYRNHYRAGRDVALQVNQSMLWNRRPLTVDSVGVFLEAVGGDFFLASAS